MEKISDRIVAATFKGSPKMTVISYYSPTNTSNNQIAKQFYEELSATARETLKHNMLVIEGDMNAKAEESKVIPRSFNKATNRNGDLLLDLIAENDLVCLNTY